MKLSRLLLLVVRSYTQISLGCLSQLLSLMISMVLHSLNDFDSAISI